MLSAEVINVIKATVPALVAHGETLTRHFYRRMFEGNPETRAFFNPAHQHTGGQQKALAGAICAYAQNIENLGALTGAVELIAQKHASLGVQPEHYPIVGKHLLASIREVLGAAATDDVINAWAAAYGMLAEIFIAREAQIYAGHRKENGAAGFRPFVVQRKVRESDRITSFYLAPVDGSPLRPHKPGQYVTVRVPTEGEGTTMRNYSISSRPGRPHYRISVKRETGLSASAPDGYASNYLHQHVNELGVLEVGPPCGEFILKPAGDRSRSLVLISAGVGITPLLSMLHAASERRDERDILFIHAAVNGDSHAFRREVLQLADEHPNVRVHFRYSNPTPQDRLQELADSEGFVDADLLKTLLSERRGEFYLCGPKPFMSDVSAALTTLGVPKSDVSYEFFGPLQDLTPPQAVAV